MDHRAAQGSREVGRRLRVRIPLGDVVRCIPQSGHEKLACPRFLRTFVSLSLVFGKMQMYLRRAEEVCRGSFQKRSAL